MGVSVKVLYNKLPGAPGKARSWSGQVTQRSADRMVVRAKQLVLKDTHETENNIESIKTGPFTRTVQSSRPSTDGRFNVPAHIEYKLKPYMRPALEEERGRFLDDVDRIIESIV